MVVKLLSATDIKQLEDLINKFVVGKDNELRKETPDLSRPFGFKVDVKVVPSQLNAGTSYIAVIQY